MNVIIRIVITVLLCIALLGSSSTYATEGKKMDYLYDFKDSIALAPEMFKIEAGTTLSLFPVPMDNAVGTNDLKNAITVISFPNGKLDMENYFRSLFDDVRGGGTFLPVIQPDSIAFGQTRRFLLFNFKTGSHKTYRVLPSIDEKIENIAIADARMKKFIFETEGLDRHSEDHNDGTFYLQLFDLSGDEAKLIKKIDIGTGSIWTVAHDRVFLWYFSRKVMEVYDLNLKPAQHPLGDLIKKYKDKVNFTRLAINPTLPFALLYGGEKDEVLVNWDSSKSKIPQSLFGDQNTSTQFSFSPDGRWLVFQEGGVMDQKRTYMMPVSEKYPNYLGSPILLLKKRLNPPNFTWTTNPVGFVISRLEDLYRWELTKEAQKSMMGNDADKYPTFHDYIVAKDLEKLTKEKKQGLGK